LAQELCDVISHDLFVTLLRENEKGIVDQAIWGIGNLAADKVKFRD
jgi:hypothetical protein